MFAASSSSAPQLGERFVLTTLLGAGSFGRVYRATDQRYGMDVALKVLTGFHSEALRLFKDEFRALAHVSHANLVTLYELHSHGDAWFYTMEHVPGLTLGRWATTTSPSADALRGALLQMASGIAALHEAGLCHRDLKPANVLVSRDGRIAVSDFGLVGALDPRRKATDDRVIGTLAYSAPEVWSGAPVGPPADWFAFGVTLFELLTGKLPFADVAARTRGDGPRPSSVMEGVPEDLDELCEQLLKRDPAARPSADAVLAVLAGRVSRPPVWTSSVSRFVDRSPELDALEQALEAAGSTGATLHLIGGPSGIGKSSLLDEAARRATSRGALVLRGRCHPQDALTARGLDGVVDALGRFIGRSTAPRRAELVPEAEPALARMFPTLTDVLPRARAGLRGETTSKEERQAALAALARIFGRLAARSPLVIAIDDLHWADEETASAIVSLLESLKTTRSVLVIGTFRADHSSTSPCLRVLRDSVENAQTHLLGPLSKESAEAMVRGVLQPAEAGSPRDPVRDEARLSAVLAAAQGNPYLLQELAAHLRRPESAASPSSEGGLFDEVMLSRTQALSSSARRVLEILTLAEMPLPVDVVIEAAQLAERDYLGDLTTLRANRLVSPRLTEGRESLETYHGRVREALDRAIPSATRPALHLRLAEALERASAAPKETIAQHYFAAHEMVRAYEHARAAAALARDALAFGRCVSMLELAASTGVATSKENLEIRSELADALANAGRGPEAAAVFLSLVPLDPEHESDHERRAAEQYLYSGHLKEGLEVLRRVLSRVGLSLPTSRVLSVARVLWAQTLGPGRRVLSGKLAGGTPNPALYARIDACNTATLGLTMTDPLASAVMQAENLAGALQAEEPERLARALSTHLVHTAGGWYDPARTRRIGEQVETLMEGERSAQTVAMVALARAGAAWMEGRLAESKKDADHTMVLLRRSSCVGMQWHINTHHVMELELLEQLGRWDEVALHLPPYLLDARERGDRFLEASLRVRFRPTVLLAADQVSAAREEIAIARRSWDQSNFDLIALYGGIKSAWCDLYEGDVEAAKKQMDATWSETERSLLVRVVFYRDMVAAARGMCLLAWARRAAPRERGRALREVRSIEASFRSTASPVPQANAQLLLAAARSIEGHPDASAAYEQAARAFEQLGATLHAAACRFRADGRVPTGLSLARPERVLAMLAP